MIVYEVEVIVYWIDNVVSFVKGGFLKIFCGFGSFVWFFVAVRQSKLFAERSKIFSPLDSILCKLSEHLVMSVYFECNLFN